LAVDSDCEQHEEMGRRLRRQESLSRTLPSVKACLLLVPATVALHAKLSLSDLRKSDLRKACLPHATLVMLLLHLLANC
jgi:hypothetical protein